MQQVTATLFVLSSCEKISSVKTSRSMAFAFIANIIGKGLSAIATICFWYERSQTRKHLNSLEDWQLDDVGLTREEAASEADKYFWQD